MAFNKDQFTRLWQQLLDRTAPLRERLRPTVSRIHALILRGWQKRPTWRQWGKIGLFAFLAGLLTLFLLFVSVYFGAFGPLPAYAELRGIQNYTASEVYAEDGVLLGKYFVENRINADFEEISGDIINALVATEDARFFQHNGIDPRALARVAIRSILLGDESAGGGSTISQQLAKNLFPRRQYWILTVPVNKIREMFVARRLERIYSKEDILRLYLNTVPFGENIFGLKVAARRFFNKAPDQLQLEETAALIGMLKATFYYNPRRFPERARERRNTVLRQMVRYGYLRQEACDSLAALPVATEYFEEGHNQGLATYFRTHLQLELDTHLDQVRKPDGSRYNLFTDGLKIYTTIDSRLQRYAEEAVREVMPRIQQNFYNEWRKGTPWGKQQVLDRAIRELPAYRTLKARGLSEAEILETLAQPATIEVFSWDENTTREWSPIDSLKYYLTLLNTGLLSIDPHTGLVKAWVGGIDHRYIQYDHVKARRQVGSTFKPIVYAQALIEGFPPCEFRPSRLTAYPEYENWEPQNSDGEYGDYYSMPGALSKSINTLAVETILEVGVDSVRQLAIAMGMPENMPDGPAISLGAVDASLLDMVGVYATFVNAGATPQLHYLDRVENSQGEVILQFDRPNPEAFPQVLPRDVAAGMTHMLQTVVDSGTARRLRYEYGLNNAIAGKTGTTQNHSDGWFLGALPDLVTGVWVGAENPSVHFRTLSNGQGAGTALPIWAVFHQKVLRDRQFRAWREKEFTPLPDSLFYDYLCPLSLPDLPILDELLDDYFENPGFFEALYRELQAGSEDFDFRTPIQLKRRRRAESELEYLERMQRFNERLQRRDDRRDELREFWSDLLFKKMNEEKARKEAEENRRQNQ